jgi:glycosyltransferase involved in cell wall biosynthesis
MDSRQHDSSLKRPFEGITTARESDIFSDGTEEARPPFTGRTGKQDSQTKGLTDTRGKSQYLYSPSFVLRTYNFQEAYPTWMMRRALVISYFCPPQPEAASVRVGYLARELPGFGWDVTVLTRPYSGYESQHFEILTAGSATLGQAEKKPVSEWFERFLTLPRRVVNFGQTLLYFPDRAMPWLCAAVPRALAATRRKRFDAIISTYGPGTAHLTAYFVAKATGLPWVADYRDLWHDNPLVEWGGIRRALLAQLERCILTSASRITAVDGIGEQLAKFHQRDIIGIPNAVDLSSGADAEDSPPCCFQLCYAGRLYDGERSPDLLFRVLASMRAQHNEAGLAARVTFYGPDSYLATRLAERYGLEEIVTAPGWVERKTVLHAERESAVLLIFLGEKTGAFTGSKVLEYLSVNRPILAIGPPWSHVGDILRASGAGMLVSTEEECYTAIEELYRRFQRCLFTAPKRNDWSPWTPRDLAAAFAKVLTSAVQDPRAK